MKKYVVTSFVELAHTRFLPTRYGNVRFVISYAPVDASPSPYATSYSQKMDLGACPKSHTERLKTEFLAAREQNPSDPIFAKFQTEYENNIFVFVDECDRRIRTAQRRLEKTPEENAKTTNLVCIAPHSQIAVEG